MTEKKSNRMTGTGRMCRLALLFAFILCSGSKVYAGAQAVAEIPLEQKFEVRQTQQEAVNTTGTYEMTALDEGAPMPEGSQGKTYSFSLEGNEKTALLLTYGHGGVWKYRIVQTTPDAEHYTYDRTEYTVSVYVKNGKDGELIPQLVVENEQNQKCESLHYDNVYQEPDKPAKPDKPDKPDKPVKPDKPAKPGNTGKPDKGTTPAKTGDSAGMFLWMGIFISSALAILLVVRRQKKHLL